MILAVVEMNKRFKLLKHMISLIGTSILTVSQSTMTCPRRIISEQFSNRIVNICMS